MVTFSFSWIVTFENNKLTSHIYSPIAKNFKLPVPICSGVYMHVSAGVIGGKNKASYHIEL